MVDGSSVGAVASYDFTNVTADHTIAATFDRDVLCDEYLKSAIIKLTWYDPGASNSSMIKTNDVPFLNSPTFNGTLSKSGKSGEITITINLTDPYYVGSSDPTDPLIVTLEVDPDSVETQESFVVEIYLDGVLFVTVPMNSQGKVGSAEVVFAALDTVMTDNCVEGDSMDIDIEDDTVTINIY